MCAGPFLPKLCPMSSAFLATLIHKGTRMKGNVHHYMTRIFLSAVLIFFCGCFLAPAQAAGEYTGPKLRFRLAHPCPPGHHTTRAFDKFAALVAQKSNGRIKVHVFPNAVLGSDEVMLRDAQRGRLEMAVSSSPNLTPVVPSLIVFDFPYITSPKYQRQLYEAIDHGPLNTYFKGKFNEIGLEPIMYSEYGYRDFFTVRKPIRTLEDLKGIQVRTTASPVEVEVAKALGMKPKILAWGETYTGLKEGIVEAEGNTFSFLLHAEHEDVLKYAFTTHHNYSMQILSANLEWWKQLDPRVQRIIREAASEALAYQREVLAVQSEDEARRRFMHDGIAVVDPTDAQLAELKEKTRPVWDRFKATVPQDLIELVVATQK